MESKVIYMLKEKNYAWSTDKEYRYVDGFGNVEECIQEAKNSGCEVGDIIYVIEVQKSEIRGVELSDILERVHDNMCVDYGECAEEWDVEDESNVDNKVYKKYEDAINDLIIKYLEEVKMMPNFFDVIDEKQVVIE